MNNRNIKEILFYFSLIFMMVFSFNLALKDFVGIDIHLIGVFLISLSASASASMLLLFPAAVSAGLIPAAGFLLFYCYKEPASVRLYLKEAQEFTTWLLGYLAGYNYFEKAYSLLFIIVITLLAALITSTAVYKGKGVLPLILAGTAVMAYFWFVYVESARLYLALFLFASIMLYSYRTFKKRLREWIAAGCIIDYKAGRNWMICSGVVIAAALLFSAALPLKIGPVRWQWLNDKAVSLFPFITEWRNDVLESYSFSSAGYSDNKLGGEIRWDDSVVMLVRTRGEEALYLRGTVMDRYYENSWNKSGKRYKEYKPGHLMPIPYGKDIKVYTRDLEISHRKLLTSTIFAPYSLYRIQHGGKRTYMDEDSEAYASKIAATDTSYRVTSIIPYIDVAKLRLSGAETLEEDDLRRYTALPEDIPERVRSLSHRITNAYSSNYDKAKAIEKYLRQNYMYSLKPPQLPSNKEFTDYFLFEGKEGYCTYFATSMAVLLRASGIPCRYVEGFIASYEGSEEREVRGTDAHAWVEVFFDGYGWVTFEPTPQYPVVEILEPGSVKDEVFEGAANDTVTVENKRAGMPGYFGQPEGAERVGNGTISGDIKKSYNFAKIILLIALSALTARVIFLYVKQAITEIGLGRSSGKRFAADYIEDINRYLRRAGFEMKGSETLREFMNRVGLSFRENPGHISKIITILEKTRYGGYEPCANERSILKVFRKEVKAFAIKKAGILRYFISMYVLGDRKNAVQKFHVEFKKIT
ncbi:MAG TPA: transglutaminaseTgpA domain-containing protein [Bacillota bacterium]|nr:transglutaminaseTgpA domain-containing protein [Bacillota bacterium]